LATLFYSPKNSSDRKALDKAVERGQLKRIRAAVYTDDHERTLEEIIADHLPSILSLAFPSWTISHSTAATLKPINRSAFISGSKRTPKPAKLQSITVNRLAALPHPESIQVDLGDMVARSLTAEPEPVRVRLSSPLQNVFELLDSDARQPNRTLPVETIRGLIDALSETDKLRAPSFAERNGLLAELTRFNALRAGSENLAPAATRTYESLDLFFYHWHVGTLDSLPAREFRFSYHDNWNIPLPGLSLSSGRASYEGPGLPAFFDNLLPEGWAESRLQAVHKIAREDTFALLRTTQKYLSNFTLRPRDFEESRVVLDYLDVTLADFSQSDDTFSVDEQVGLDPDSRQLWLELKRRGATRLSGIQPKLPVHLTIANGRLQIEIGHVGNTSTHILKLPSPEFPHLVDNEWTTMELARRVGLPVPLVKRVEFPSDSDLKSPGLLIERFDLPASLSSPREVLMLEEAAVLLGVRREEKYNVSMERIASALLAAGASLDDMDRFADHVIFSWIVGNGDLHAKNIAVLRSIEPGMLGNPPRLGTTRYSPLYDLVNTRLVIKGDLFALPVNGKQNNLRVNDFAALTRYWGRTKQETAARTEYLKSRVLAELPAVLNRSLLPDNLRESYERTVNSALESLS
jgi:serine/threonine-protein kinase HipA